MARDGMGSPFSGDDFVSRVARAKFDQRQNRPIHSSARHGVGGVSARWPSSPGSTRCRPLGALGPARCVTGGAVTRTCPTGDGTAARTCGAAGRRVLTGIAVVGARCPGTARVGEGYRPRTDNRHLGVRRVVRGR
jgi:hypothetical protein